MRRLTLLALLVLFTPSLAAAAVRQGAPPASSSARPDVIRQLNSLAAHRVTLPPDVLRKRLVAALQSPDGAEVLTGLWALASRAAGFRFTPSEARKALWWQEQPVVQDLRPLAEARLADPDDRVRHAAIIALGSLDYHVDRHPLIHLRPDTVTAFARAFREDRAVAVRAEAVKSLALAQSDPELRDAVLVEALSDPAPGVVQFAALGVAKHRLEAALPAVAALLGHPSRAVRSAAVQALQANPGAARTYQPDVRRTLAAEADPSVKAMLRATLATLEQP